MFSKFVFHILLRFKFEGGYPKDLKKSVLIGAPHTSWVDFVLGLAFKNISGVNLSFIGKKSLFDSFFGFFFKAMGGIPVDRSKNANVVDTVVDIFNSKEEFHLAISPEGTRSKVDKWKTGFYHIAKLANVPILMLTFDYEKRQVKVSEPYYTTDDMEKDFAHFHKFYENVKRKNN